MEVGCSPSRPTTFFYIATLLDARFLALQIPLLFTDEMRKDARAEYRAEYANSMHWAPSDESAGDEAEAHVEAPSREEESELLNNGRALRDGSLESFMSSMPHLVSPLASPGCTAPSLTPAPKKAGSTSTWPPRRRASSSMQRPCGTSRWTGGPAMSTASHT